MDVLRGTILDCAADLRPPLSPIRMMGAPRQATMTEPGKKLTTADALQGWRDAERAAAVARRGKLAASVAVTAAEHAAKAALATAAAAKSALEFATLAEESASKTAASSKLVVEATKADQINADTDSAMADAHEIEARERYRGVVHTVARD